MLFDVQPTFEFDDSDGARAAVFSAPFSAGDA
jgi:hypothetical protein